MHDRERDEIGPRRRFSEAFRKFLFHAAGGVCAGCGARMSMHHDKWVVWHETTRALGGSDTMSNLSVAHATCNAQRAAQEEIPAVAKAERLWAAATGQKKPPRNPIPGSRCTGWKHRLPSKNSTGKTWVRR